MTTNEGLTGMSERQCDCGSEEGWKEVGSTWLCTCPGNGTREETEETLPAYSDHQLMAKILEIYPEILKHAINFSLSFNARKNAYVLDFRKGRHELTTHLEKKDADECMANIKCVYLGVQVGRFIRNFEEEVMI
jgi:hypothetical protein